MEYLLRVEVLSVFYVGNLTFLLLQCVVKLQFRFLEVCVDCSNSAVVLNQLPRMLQSACVQHLKRLGVHIQFFVDNHHLVLQTNHIRFEFLDFSIVDVQDFVCFCYLLRIFVDLLLMVFQSSKYRFNLSIVLSKVLIVLIESAFMH